MMVFIFSILICLSSILLCLYWIPLLRLVSDYFIRLFVCSPVICSGVYYLLWFLWSYLWWSSFKFFVISLNSLSLEVIIVEFFIYRRFVLPWPGGALVIDCIDLFILNYPYSFKGNEYTAQEGRCCVSGFFFSQLDSYLGTRHNRVLLGYCLESQALSEDKATMK